MNTFFTLEIFYITVIIWSIKNEPKNMPQKHDMWLVDRTAPPWPQFTKYFSEWIEMMKDIDC